MTLMDYYLRVNPDEKKVRATYRSGTLNLPDTLAVLAWTPRGRRYTRVGSVYRYPFPDDPNYLSDPATFIRGAVSALLDYAVVPDPTMGRRLIEISKKEREIRVLPGQSIRRFHQLIDIASLYVVGGVAWAPEFHTGPRLHLVTNERRHSGDGSCCPTCRQAIGGG